MVNINKDLLRGIIFDYGGTIDSRGDHWSEVIWDAYKKAAIIIPKDAFREAYVYAERELAKTRHILPHHTFYDLLLIKMKIELKRLAEQNVISLNQQALEAKAVEIADYCYDSAKSSIEDARPILNKLYNNYPLVLVSNFYGNVEAVLEDFDLKKYFKEIVESAVVGVRKPDPKIFELGVEALQLEPQQVLVIGDSYRKDIVPAETIGCQVLWLKGKGWTAEEDEQMHPNIISSLSEIEKILNV